MNKITCMMCKKNIADEDHVVLDVRARMASRQLYSRLSATHFCKGCVPTIRCLEMPLLPQSDCVEKWYVRQIKQPKDPDVDGDYDKIAERVKGEATNQE